MTQPDQHIAIPEDLKLTQKWFAQIITTPLTKNNTTHYKTSNGNLIAEEAKNYIAPSATLLPHQRIQIYNQQYWWRLLNTLQTNFPLLTRLLGYKDFNENIAVPYLVECPPNHWALTLVGERLPEWIKKNYKHPDRSIIGHATQLDWAFTMSLVSPKFPSLDLSELTGENPERILNKTFFLQPHIHLFKWNSNLFLLREELLKQEEKDWKNHRIPLPKKEKDSFFILYRTEKNTLAWRQILEGEYFLLQLIQEGISIEQACEKIEQNHANLYEQAINHLQQWIQTWIQLDWLTEKKNVNI